MLYNVALVSGVLFFMGLVLRNSVGATREALEAPEPRTKISSHTANCTCPVFCFPVARGMVHIPDRSCTVGPGGATVASGAKLSPDITVFGVLSALLGAVVRVVSVVLGMIEITTDAQELLFLDGDY